MAKERKRVEKPIVNKIEPRKREKPLVVPKEPVIVKEEVVEIVPEVKVKKSDDKYIRIPYESNQEERKQMNDRVHKGELKYGYFAIDGDKSYDYYLVLKK